MRVVILPLDSRPCTHDFPFQIAQGGGLEPLVPPLELMDHYREPSEFARIAGWLKEHCAGARGLICALDQLAYGGLLASRALDVPEEQALERVNFLRRLKKSCPELKIYLSSVIMRTTVSTLRQEDLIWWEKVAEYSKLTGQTDPQAQQAREALEREIPPNVLDTFLAVRRRNHQVNRQAIRLLADGVVEEVCFLQEDSAPQGMHRAEQRQLRELADDCGVSGRVSIHCGTDEYAAAMAGRLAAQRLQPDGPALRLYVEWLAGDKNFVAGYEDRPFVQNLEAYLETCAVQQVDRVEDAQAILAIYAPEDGQRDLAIAPEQAVCTYTAAQLDKMVSRLGGLIEQGLPVGLLDVYFAGGGEGCLLRRLGQQGLLKGLAAYAGWNTASNSLGTILGQLLALRAGGRNPMLDRFTQERLLDDWLYQGIVRPQWNRGLREQGIDVWDLPDPQRAEVQLQRKMEQVPERALVCPGPFQARLRWRRTFEVHISVGEENP